MKLFNIIRNFIFICFEFVKLTIVSIFCVPIVEVLYGGFWNYRAHLIKSNRIRTRLYDMYLAYIIHSGFISGYQNRYGDNLKPPTNVYHRMTA